MGRKVTVSKAIFSEQDEEDVDNYSSVLGSNFSKLSVRSFNVPDVGEETLKINNSNISEDEKSQKRDQLSYNQFFHQ